MSGDNFAEQSISSSVSPEDAKCNVPGVQPTPKKSDVHCPPMKHNLRAFPVLEVESFLFGIAQAGLPRRRTYVAFHHGPKPHIVKTDTTRCLIRALRARADSTSLASVAVRSSMSPSVRLFQQQSVDLQELAANPDDSTGMPSSAVASTAAKQNPSESKPFDRNQKTAKSTRVGLSWSNMTRDRRQACLRISLAAAVLKSPAACVSELYRVWQVDPCQPQRVTPEIRRELAESSFKWSLSELKSYLREAGLSHTGQRLELARRVHLHIRPPSEAVFDGSKVSTSEAKASRAS